MLNRLTRRGFFQVILAAVSTATLVISPAVADAIEQYPEDKISKAVRLAHAAMATKTDLSLTKDIVLRDRQLKEGTAAIYKLLSFTNNAFDARSATSDEIHTVVVKPDFLLSDGLNEEALSRLAEGVIPVAIVHELLGKGLVRFRSVEGGGNPFDVFINHYIKGIAGNDLLNNAVTAGYIGFSC